MPWHVTGSPSVRRRVPRESPRRARPSCRASSAGSLRRVERRGARARRRRSPRARSTSCPGRTSTATACRPLVRTRIIVGRRPRTDAARPGLVDVARGNQVADDRRERGATHVHAPRQLGARDRLMLADQVEHDPPVDLARRGARRQAIVPRVDLAHESICVGTIRTHVTTRDARRRSQRGLAGQRAAQHLRAGANHLGVAAEREANGVGAVFAERVARRAADAVRGELAPTARPRRSRRAARRATDRARPRRRTHRAA